MCNSHPAQVLIGSSKISVGEYHSNYVGCRAQVHLAVPAITATVGKIAAWARSQHINELCKSSESTTVAPEDAGANERGRRDMETMVGIGYSFGAAVNKKPRFGEGGHSRLVDKFEDRLGRYKEVRCRKR